MSASPGTALPRKPIEPDSPPDELEHRVPGISTQSCRKVRSTRERAAGGSIVDRGERMRMGQASPPVRSGTRRGNDGRRAATHEDLAANATCRVLSSRNQRADYDTVSKAIDEHLGEDRELLIIYFAGHALATRSDVQLLVATPGIKKRPDFISMRDLLRRTETTKSKILNTVILLDCCYAGASIKFAARPLSRGVTILAAADADQKALESFRRGEFTRIAADGLRAQPRARTDG